MTLEVHVVAGVAVAILAQRLVRLNCAKCRQRYTPSADEIETLKLTAQELEDGKFAKGVGCADCRGTGYRGRLGVFELLLGTPEVRAGIARNATFPEMAEIAARQDFRSMMQDGKYKVMQGWTTPEEVIKAVYTQAID
jgi:type II secretory ATPase GspE/PulE/Tfp pilus assembly ATPase PilB-like protein